jgi:hypothetical protein
MALVQTKREALVGILVRTTKDGRGDGTAGVLDGLREGAEVGAEGRSETGLLEGTAVGVDGLLVEGRLEGALEE